MYSIKYYVSDTQKYSSEKFNKKSKPSIFHLYLLPMAKHGQSSGCPPKMTDSLPVNLTGTQDCRISCMQKELILMHAHA